MIFLTPEQSEKLKTLDLLFNTLSNEELKSIISSDLIMQKLSGEPQSTFSVFQETYNNNQYLSSEILRLSNEIVAIKSDLGRFARANQTQFQHPDYAYLLSKYQNIY